MTTLTFQQALAQADDKKHLLLGNGFSIALKPDIFTYGSLYEHADFSDIPYADQIFDALKTKDFEAVIRILVDAAKLLKVYEDVDADVVQKIRVDAEILKTILVNTIASRHPDRPYDITAEQYAHCRQFLSNFSHIYTLNYDVLLYWALMQDQVDELDLLPDDGFRSPEDDHDAPYVTWQEADQAKVHYLHGALHLFDAGHEITKYTWRRTTQPIIEQIRTALNEGKYPLFVSEGHSKFKQERVLHNAYLHKALRSFSNVGGSLFIFGHSLDINDDHILNEIVKNTKFRSLFISLHGSASAVDISKIKTKATLMAQQRATKSPRKPLDIHFFSAESAQVWG